MGVLRLSNAEQFSDYRARIERLQASLSTE